MKSVYYITLLIVILVILIFSLNAFGAETRIIYASSTTAQSSDYPGHVKIAELGSSAIGEVTVISLGGTEAATQALYNNESDVSGSTGPALYESINGLGSWTGKKLPNITRVLHIMAMLDIPICVREGIGINSISDLKGREVFLGFPGTTTNGVYKLIFDALGIEIKEYVGELSDGVEAMKDKKIDVFIKSVNGNSLDATHMDIMTSTPIKFITFTDEEIEKIRGKYPWLTFRKFPAGYFSAFPDLGELWMYSTPKLTACRDNFPEEWAYSWVKNNVEKREEILKVWKSAGLVDLLETPGIVGQIPGLFLHPGAIRYYKERGIEIPESVIPPEMK